MMVGLIITVAWKFLPAGFLPVSQNIIGVLFAMFCNTVFLLASHYILRQPGGWVGIKDRVYLDEQKIHKQQNRAEFVEKLWNFSPRKLFQKLAPRSELTYVALGAYFVVYTITTMYTTQIELLGSNAELMKIVYPSMLVSGTMMMMYPIWPLSIATSIKRAIIETWYPIAVFYMLILFSYFFVLVSKFAMLQVALFVANMMVAALLLGWRVAVPAIATGFYLGIEFYQHFFGKSGFEAKFGSPEFILMYVVLILGSIVIFLLKPKQELQEATDARVGTLKTEVVHLDHEVINLNSRVSNLNEAAVHYNERISDQEKEIERLGATAQKILNNVNHELRLPVGNVMNFAEMLNEGLGNFDESQLKMLSDEVYKNSNRLSSMIMNMLDLAALNAKKLELDKKIINLGELVADRVNNCRKIYLEGKKIDFVLKIHPEIFVSVDPNYMRQVVDNLVINAIKFSDEGIINVTLLKQKNHIEFVISDSGIGIPQEDIYDIFTPFKMGSNSESKAEGRGVGLALCKAAIEAHGGVITVDSKGGKGAIFKFVL
jgi:signal transduction histidine kinase